MNGSTGRKDINHYRKLFHFLAGCVVVATLVIFEPSKRWAIWLLAVSTGILVAIDIVRHVSRLGGRLFWEYLGFLTSDKDRRGPTTSVFYAVTLMLVVLVLPTPMAVGAILSLAAGDPAAAIVGRRWGRIRLGRKSLEGAFANAATSFILMRPFVHSTVVAAAGSVAGAAAELLEVPLLDDNITIPLAAGGAMYLTAYFTGF